MKEVEKLTSHSYKSHKLWESLVSCITNHLLGNAPDTPMTNEYERNKTRIMLKKEYLKAIGYEPSKKPIEDFHKLVDEMPNLTDKQKNMLKLQNIRAIQDTLCKDNNFSTALNLMSQKSMNKLIIYTIDLMKDYNIEFRKEIIDLFKEQDMRSYIYICLKYQKCCVCGRDTAEIHHVDHVTKIGGRKHDDGTKLRIMPLCRNCHSEMHNNERKFLKENEIDGAIFSEEEIEKLLPIYKNQFEALREKINGRNKT